MLVHILEIMDNMQVVIFMILVKHYVFLEPLLKKGKMIFWLFCCSGIILSELGNMGDLKILVPFIMVGIYIAFSRREHRIQGFFMCFPLLGLGYGLFALFDVPLLLIGTTSEKFTFRYYAVIDSLVWIILLLFWCKGKKWRNDFEHELQYRNLKKWERCLLFLDCWLSLFAACIVVTMVAQSQQVITLSMRVSISMICIILSFLAISIVIAIWQGNKQAYYRGIAQVNERYLKAELKHFQAYQQTQIETRRIRHDMKNQLTSLNHFVRQKDWNAVQRYMDEICGAVENIDCSLHCGNSLADAIINEKQQTAAKKGIRFEIEGTLPEHTYLNPIDICTIFSNAFDNGIEALDNNNIAKEQKWLRLKIEMQGQVLFLCFKNPITEEQMMGKVGVTTKKDAIYHGFGLQNIELAAKKYQGNISIRTEEGEVRIFVLEVMLMNGQKSLFTT